MNTNGFAEHHWLDGTQPTQLIRSKSRVVARPKNSAPGAFPAWGLDGFSTGQATAEESDCLLEPAHIVNDPRRGFRSRVAYRGASIRIPQSVAMKGYGYLEDCRPGANADPYRVVTCLAEATCVGVNAGAPRPLVTVEPAE